MSYPFRFFRQARCDNGREDSDLNVAQYRSRILIAPYAQEFLSLLPGYFILSQQSGVEVLVVMIDKRQCLTLERTFFMLPGKSLHA